MIRKAIIVVLTLGAMSFAAVSAISYGTRLNIGEFWLGDSNAVVFSCVAGHANLSWLRTEEGGRSLDFRFYQDANIVIINRIDLILGPMTDINITGPSGATISSIKAPFARVAWRTRVTTQPPIEYTEIQVWAWLLVAAFASYPTIAFIRGPLRRWRRHRKGLCLRCGYNLVGNVSGVCSECGEAT